MTDRIANAQNAAATPANGAPAPAPAASGSGSTFESQRQAIMKNPAYWSGDGPESKALREQMKSLLASAPGDEPVAPKQQEKEVKPEPDANETRRLELTKRLVTDKALKPAEREELTRELRSILAAGENEDEKTARGNLTVRERRGEFGVKDAPLHGPELESYNENYAGHEVALFDVARENGLDAGQVRGLRDEAIKLGQVIGERGKPATDAEVKAIFERLKVPASSRPALMKLWREVEGGGP